MHSLGEGQQQINGLMAKYSCIGNEWNLDDCSFDVDENICQSPASSIIACSKSYNLEDIDISYIA